MSDQSQGPGWWQAADGKWYPPEAATMPAATPSVPGYPMGAGAPPPDAKGFIKSLYDFQFDHFVTPKLIRFFYAFFVIVLSLGAALFFLATLASGEGGAVVFALIFVPIMYFVYLILTRIYFELISALFRIADDLRAIRNSKGV